MHLSDSRICTSDFLSLIRYVTVLFPKMTITQIRFSSLLCTHITDRFLENLSDKYDIFFKNAKNPFASHIKNSFSVKAGQE